MFTNPLLAVGAPSFVLDLSVSESNVNIWTKLGSPSFPATVIVTVKDTAVITNLTTGAWADGSLIRLQMNGYVLGSGGKGGNGEESDLAAGEPGVAGTAGNPGSTAFIMLAPVLLTQNTGRIWGGGGGGGGGIADSGFNKAGGGGGGGVSGGLGGDGGYFQNDGTDATSGINAVPGVGGTSVTGGDGGNGGDWGQAGQPGDFGYAGGNAGLAIAKNGYALTFLGKSQAQLVSEGLIKGVVS